MNEAHLRFDLGRVASRQGWKSVNPVGAPDIRCDLLDVDSYAPVDGSVEAFLLSHTLQQIPSDHYKEFLIKLRRKLRSGGTIEVIQTDAAAVLQQWQRGELGFRAMRSTLFPPADRLRKNPHHRHFQMWSGDELIRDFEYLGFHCSQFDAGSWSLDTNDEIVPDELARYRGVQIKNLGIRASKPKIPRTIHQTWKTRQVPPQVFPREWIESWSGPSTSRFDYRLWTDKDNRALIQQHYPWFLNTYDGYPKEIMRVDAARYFILHRFGGIYVDLDFVRLRSLDPLLERTNFLFAFQSPGSIANAIMGCEPGHPLIEAAIHQLASHSTRGVLEATGPEFLTALIRREGYMDEVLPSELLYPYEWNDQKKPTYAKMSVEELRREFPSAFAVTHWTATWHTP